MRMLLTLDFGVVTTPILKGIYNTSHPDFPLDDVVTTPILKSIYNLYGKIPSHLNVVTTHNLKGIYNHRT